MSAFVKTHYYGWRPDKPDFRDLIYKPHIQGLSKTVDLRPLCPPIYDQGDLGSCTANAISAHLDFNRHKQGEDFIAPSRLFIYYQERLLEDTVDSDSGASIRNSAKVVKKYGAPPETEWPYVISKFKTEPPTSAYSDAVKYEDLTYQSVTRSVNDFKACLTQGYPFVAGISVYDSFESPEANKTGVIPMPQKTESLLGGHAIMIVGYTDNQWIFRNSWGSGWGEQGFGFLPQAYLINSGLSSSFWTLRAVK